MPQLRARPRINTAGRNLLARSLDRRTVIGKPFRLLNYGFGSLPSRAPDFFSEPSGFSGYRKLYPFLYPPSMNRFDILELDQ